MLLFRGADFLTGLAAGLAAFGATLAWAIRARRHAEWPGDDRGHSVLVPAGVLFALAGTVALLVRGQGGVELAAGVVLLGFAGRRGRSSIAAVAPVAGLAGVLVVAHASPPDAGSPEVWALAALGAAAVPLVVRAERLDPPGSSSYLALAFLGVFFTVPDTETAAVLLGTVIPLGLAAWPRPLARLGPAGAAALTGLLVYCAGQGGWARPGTMVASVACLGILLVLPCVDFVRPRAARRLLEAPLEARGLVQLGIVFLASRVLVAHDLATAAGLEGSFLALLTLAVVVLARTDRHRRTEVS